MSGVLARGATEDGIGVAPRRPWLSPLNQRRWHNFKSNGRGYWSLWIFIVLFVLSMFSEFVANDRPIVVSYKGEILFPVLVDYPEEKFGGFYAVTDYRDPVISEEIEANTLLKDADITGLPPLPRGSTIELVLNVNNEGLIRLSAREPQSGKELEIEARISVLEEKEVELAKEIVSGLMTRS